MEYDTERLLAELHPHAVNAFRRLTELLYSSYEKHETPTHFRPVEGLRSPLKQRELCSLRLEHVAPWHSPHQYGLAMRFQPYLGAGHWSEAPGHAWPFLGVAAAQCGLVVHPAYRRGQIVHPFWNTCQNAMTGRL